MENAAIIEAYFEGRVNVAALSTEAINALLPMVERSQRLGQNMDKYIKQRRRELSRSLPDNTLIEEASVLEKQCTADARKHWLKTHRGQLKSVYQEVVNVCLKYNIQL